MSKIKWLGKSRLKQWQRLSLAFLTMMLVTLLSVSPSLTQQYSSEQISVTKKIEATAVRHHEAKLPNVDHAVDEHKDEALKAGLTVPEIRKIYTQKMASLNKNDPWQQWQPFGWVAAVVMGSIAIFRDAFVKKISEVSKAIIDNIYKRFSGTQLFRNFALQRYRTALNSKYQELKIPFRPNRPLKMAEVYVPLQLLEQGEPIYAKQAVQRFKRLMIVGQPGSGKTMLLKSLALNYANGPWDIPQQPVAILLELNRLSDTKLTIEQQLVKALERDDFPNGTNFVEQGLKQGIIMLLFDGLDEVNSADRPNVVRRLQDFINTYKQCRVAITCRTQVYKREFDAQVDQTVEVVDFNDQQIRKFLRPWKRSMENDKSVEQLLQALQDKSRIMELARNPLMLTIIAYLYTDTAFVLPHSRADFYQEATDILLKTWDEARQTPNRYKGRNKKLVLRHLALYGQDQTKGEQQDRRYLSWRDVHEQVKSILPGLNLKVEENLDPILEEICERSGLMMPIDGGESYQFTHLTLQEFFAASQLIDDLEGLIERFDQDPDVWRETVKLWCGLAGESTRLIRSVYQKDRVTAFSCLADAQQIEPELANEIIDYFKGWLQANQPMTGNPGIVTVSADSAIKAFGAVAADQRSGGRGQDVFNFLAQTLPVGGKAKNYAAQGLAATNIPEAAQVLATHYKDDPAIRPHLVRMGDLAVPKLKQIIEKDGDYTAIQNLGKIGTPLASKNLVPLLWDSREDIPIYAAVELAALLQKKDIEEDLAHFSEEELHSHSHNWQGIWEPFDELKNRSICQLAEQIAYLLSQGIAKKEFDSVVLPQLDPRIVLPVCVLSEGTFNKPSNDWIDTAQALLESTEQGLQLERTIPTLIEDAFNKQPQRLHWDVLLKTLPLRIQLDVLYRLSVNRPPTRNDWQNLNTTVTYILRTSCHYRLVLTIVFLLSVIALFGAYENSIQSSTFLINEALAYAFFIVPVVWLVLWRGTEEPFEPNLFMSLGVQGPTSFFREYRRLLRNQIVWNGAQAIFDTIADKTDTRFDIAVLFAALFTFAFAFAFAGAAAVIFAAAGAGSGAGAFSVAGAAAVAVFVAGAAAGAVPGAFAVPVPVAVFVFGAGVSAVFGAGVGAFAGIGIGFWVTQTKKTGLSRYLAIFAAPFFFGSPVVVGFSALFLHRVAGLSWPIVGLVWLGIVSICTLLFRRGRQLERLAQNPLRGILPDYDTAAQ